jgi:hypothetical protein
MLKRYLLACGVFLTTALVCLPGVAAAATATAAAGQSGEGLSVSPPLISASANPGQSEVLQIRIQNITSQPLILTSTSVDFGAKGEDGTPQLLFNETTSTRYSLKYWIAPIENPTIQPQAAITVPVTINVPANAEPGGHYGIIQFTGKPPTVTGGSGVAISASIGVLVLFTVNGNITHHLTALPLIVSQNGKPGKFYQYGPLGVSLLIRNDGAVHEVPTGNLTVSNLFGGKPIVLPVNPLKGNILPGTIRKFNQKIVKKSLFGYFTIKGNLTYDTNKILVVPATSFWVIPYKLVIIVLLIVIAVFLILRYGLRRYNRHVIEQARRR